MNDRSLDSNLSFWRESPALEALRQRVLSWTPEQITTGWEDVLVPQGTAEVAVAVGDEALLDWVGNWLEAHMEAGVREAPGFLASGLRVPGESMGVNLYDYCGNWGFSLVTSSLLAARPDPRYRAMTVRIADFIRRGALRAGDGVILHAANVPTVWVDTLYYCAPGFARAYALSGDTTYAEDAITQCRLHAKHLRNPGTGCWHHDADPVSGTRTANLWARGQGWILSSLAEVLVHCPPEMEGYNEVLRDYRSLAEALLPMQHGGGLWRTDPQHPDSHLETSGTSLILQALCLGVQHGWLDAYVRSSIERGYRELLTWITSEGKLMGSQSCSGKGGWDNLKLTTFGEDSFTTGFFLRFLAARQGMLEHGEIS
ncbi:MAG: glycoside hydrolase family 88 protein [Kiritimatiellae bacterium]|nr:glycoside hydrolase family 88 protein [Kiritimatiellia bacterium]